MIVAPIRVVTVEVVRLYAFDLLINWMEIQKKDRSQGNSKMK